MAERSIASSQMTPSQPASGLELGGQARGVVARRLGEPGAARRGAAVLLRDPHRHRLDAAAEVRAAGRVEQVEREARRGPHLQHGLRREHQRAQVERLPVAARHPALVGAHERVDGLEEALLGQLGHRHAARRAVEARGVRGRAEDAHAAVREPVRLEALEDGLRVVEHRRRREQLDRPVRPQLAASPALAGDVVDLHHVLAAEGAEAGVLDQLCARLGVDRRPVSWTRGSATRGRRTGPCTDGGRRRPSHDRIRRVAYTLKRMLMTSPSWTT